MLAVFCIKFHARATVEKLRNDRLLRALARQPVDTTPVWIMRQAGRYLPEYRKVRVEAGSFSKLYRTPELACKVSLQPLERYPLDAAILFSDILTVPDAMGLGLEFTDGEGPRFARPVRTAQDILRLNVPDPEEELGYVMATTRLIRSELSGRVPLMGFAGSPWTLATYMVEGHGGTDFRHIKGLMFQSPAEMHRLLKVVAEAVSSYLNAQILAGAQAIMIFDTWGGILTRRDYLQFSLGYMSRIIESLIRVHDGRRVPVILFTKGGGAWLEEMAESQCEAIGIDWTLDLGSARQRVGNQVSLQGNMDPCVLYASPERVRKEVGDVLESFGFGNGHVFNLGHGIHPTVDPEHVRTLVDAVHELSPRYHGETGAIALGETD
jgi:uroporphyrinogen decarboxylase